jgi:hypothetical protein
LGFGFVADDDVAVGEDCLQLSAEELGDEGRREVQNEGLKRGWDIRSDRSGLGETRLGDQKYLGVVRRMFAELEHRLCTVSKEEALDVEEFGSLYEGSDGRRGKMRYLEFFRGPQGGHERSRKSVRESTSSCKVHVGVYRS